MVVSAVVRYLLLRPSLLRRELTEAIGEKQSPSQAEPTPTTARGIRQVLSKTEVEGYIVYQST